MSHLADFLLLSVVVLNLYVLATSRLSSCVRASALQGIALALLPIALPGHLDARHLVHIALMSGGTLALKAILIPTLLSRAIRSASVHREVEPFVSLHLSMVLAAVLVGTAFWLAGTLDVPGSLATPLIVPTAFATMLLGFLVLVSRRKAVTQVVGYLMIENGVFIFGQTLASQMPSVVELGIFLDLLVCVFVMGIIIYHISSEFDDMDTDLLSTLKD
jgi:hydrogenase-4 component E